MDAIKVRAALETARRLWNFQPKWTAFYAAIWGTAGELRTLFPNVADLREFETTAEHGEMLRLLAALRGDDTSGNESYRVITVRLPPVLHDVLKVEAHEAFTSLNSLCIAKLLQPPPYQLNEQSALQPARAAG